MSRPTKTSDGEMSGAHLSTENDEVLARTRQLAAEWYVVNHDPQEAASHAPQFLQWIRQSALNVREYIAVARIAQTLADAG